MRKILHLLQEQQPSAHKPEPVPHAQRFALFKQKLQKYSSRRSIQNSANTNSITSAASPVAAPSKRPVSTQPSNNAVQGA